MDIQFIHPQQDEKKVSTKMTRIAFMKRIANELPAIYALAKTDSEAEVLKDMTLGAQFIDLNDPMTLYGLEHYKSKGVMSSDRVQQVMTEPITYVEEYKGEI